MITPLLLSTVTLPEAHPRAGSECPVYGFLVVSRSGPLLVDTGVGCDEPMIIDLFAPTTYPIEAQLADQGIRREDIGLIVNSHLHFDHVGNNRLFPGVPQIAQRAERRSMDEGRYTVPAWIDFPGANWRFVEGVVDIVPGVQLLPTPGHTEGHQSVVVTSDDGHVEVIAAQALYDPNELNAGASIEPLSDEEAAATRASAEAIKALNPTRVYFSHTAEVWAPDRPRHQHMTGRP